MKTIGFAATSLLLASTVLGACSSDSDTDNPAGLIEVTASGEQLALQGFAFPPSGDSPYFVDGWEVKLEHLYVTFDNVVVSEGPDTSPTDQLQKGKDVARVTGPWAVDLAKGGPLDAKSQGAQAIKITEIPGKNLDGNKAFSADTTYAFGYDIVKASANAQKLNLSGEDEVAYGEMTQQGFTVLYVGTATFKGASCTPADEHLDELPKTVHFRFGFDAATTYVNCQNPDLGGDDHDSPRGLALKSNQSTVAQLTVHPDHPFWDARIEDAPLRFDAFALVAHAKSKGESATNPVTLDDLAGVPFAPITAGGETLVNRTCSPATGGAATDLSYDPEGESFADLAQFMRYLQRSQGHLNSDGLCAVQGIEHSHDHEGEDHDDHDHEPSDAGAVETDGGSCAPEGGHCDVSAECCSNDCHDDHCH